MGVIGLLHNKESLIYLIAGEVKDETPNIFPEKDYDNLFKQPDDIFSPILINYYIRSCSFLESGKSQNSIRREDLSKNSH